HAVRDGLIAGHWSAVGSALADEWVERSRLLTAVTDDRIDGLIAWAREAGALAGKVCGAGGGGCVILWLPGEESRGAVEARVRRMGAEVLQFNPSPLGVQVTES